MRVRMNLLGVWLMIGFMARCMAQEPATTLTNATPQEKGVTELRLTNSWSINIGSPSDSSPAIGTDGTIYFGTFNGKLWALNPDGSRKWVFSAGREIKSSPAVGLDGAVYFGSRDRKFYAVAPNGTKKWEFPTGAWVDSSPALAGDGTIYFGSWDKNFYALKPDGSQKWQVKTTGEIVSSPAIGADGTIYFGSFDRNLYAVAPDGQRKWTFPTGGSIVSSPAVDQNGSLYFTSQDGFFYSLNSDGSLRWRLRTGGITESSPVIGADGIIYVGVNQELWAITSEGKQKWPRWIEQPIEATPVALAKSSVCFISRNGLLLALDEKREPEWSYYCYSYGYACPGVGTKGIFYVSDRGAYFSAIPAPTTLALSAWPKFRGNPRNTGNISDCPK